MAVRWQPRDSETDVFAAARARGEQLLRDSRRRIRPAPSPPRALFVLGCQRSGTTMLMQVLRQNPDVKTFGEFSPLNRFAPGLNRLWPQNTRRFDQRLLPLPEVARRIARSRYPLVAAKPLVESQRAPELLDAVPTSSAVWLFRHYNDVAMSNVRKFGTAAVLDNIAAMAARDRSDWRSEFVPGDDGELVDSHYRPDMSPDDAAALFWYARTRLYFDLALQSDPRVLLVNYEQLVRQPEQTLAAIYRHAGARPPDAAATTGVHDRSVGRGASLRLTPSIERCCIALWVQLHAAWRRQTS
jgi:hypothetical protein